MRWTRVFLIGVIVTLTLAALMGLAAVVSVRVNWELVGTDLVISLFSLTCLGASVPRHRDQWRWVKAVTYVVSAIGLVLMLLLIWDAFSYPTNRYVSRIAAVAIVWAIALPAMSLLAMTRFVNAIRYVRLATLSLVALLAATLSALIAADFDGDFLGRVVAANAILGGLGTVSLPILYRLYGQHNPTETVSTDLKMQIVCPRCGEGQTIPAGDSECAKCSLKFRLEIEEPRCPQCNYLLYKLTSPRCPECGRPVKVSFPLTPA